VLAALGKRFEGVYLAVSGFNPPAAFVEEKSGHRLISMFVTKKTHYHPRFFSAFIRATRTRMPSFHSSE